MKLLLFYRDYASTVRCLSDSIESVIFDWENQGKKSRQKERDTQINAHSALDLYHFISTTSFPAIVRVNGFPYFDLEEINKAIDNGASEILLPMVRKEGEIEHVLNAINGRCKLGILIETNDAVLNAHNLLKYDLNRVYLGLNDLCIDRNSDNMFNPLIDNTVTKLREISDIPFGYGGLTHPSLGNPIPCKLLLTNLINEKADFTFLRRSFYKAIEQYSPHAIYQAIKNEITQINTSRLEEVQTDLQLLETYVKKFPSECSA